PPPCLQPPRLSRLRPPPRPSASNIQTSISRARQARRSSKAGLTARRARLATWTKCAPAASPPRPRSASATSKRRRACTARSPKRWRAKTAAADFFGSRAVPRPSSKRSASHAAPFASSVTASATGHRLDLAPVSAPDPQRLAVIEPDGPYAETSAAEPPDAVPAQDSRTDE